MSDVNLSTNMAKLLKVLSGGILDLYNGSSISEAPNGGVRIICSSGYKWDFTNGAVYKRDQYSENILFTDMQIDAPSGTPSGDYVEGSVLRMTNGDTWQVIANNWVKQIGGASIFKPLYIPNEVPNNDFLVNATTLEDVSSGTLIVPLCHFVYNGSTWTDSLNAMNTIIIDGDYYVMTIDGNPFVSALDTTTLGSNLENAEWYVSGWGSSPLVTIIPPYPTSDLMIAQGEIYFRDSASRWRLVKENELDYFLANGNNLSDLTSPTSALSNLGGTSTGLSIFQASSINVVRGLITGTAVLTTGNTFALSSGYFYATIRFTNAGTVTITLPTSLGSGYEEIRLVRQGGALALSFAGVTVENSANVAACPVGGNVTLKRISTNTWIVLS